MAFCKRLEDYLKNKDSSEPKLNSPLKQVRIGSGNVFSSKCLQVMSAAVAVPKINRAIHQLRRKAHNQWSHMEGQIASMMHIAEEQPYILSIRISEKP